MQVTESKTRIRRRRSRQRTLPFVVLLVALAAVGVTLVAKSEYAAAPSAPADDIITNASVHDAVNNYCKDSGINQQISGITSGYIIAEYLAPIQLSEQRLILPFRQVGSAATATVDCKQGENQLGISIDLLLVNQADSWTYVEQVQNGTSASFSCKTVNQYGVAKELVPACSEPAGSPPQVR